MTKEELKPIDVLKYTVTENGNVIKDKLECLKTKELEKENAELKETLKTYNGCGDWDNDFHTCRVYLQREELQKCEERIIKAKEIIKSLLDCLRQDTNDPQTNYYVGLYMREADQFLKDSKVKK